MDAAIFLAAGLAAGTAAFTVAAGRADVLDTDAAVGDPEIAMIAASGQRGTAVVEISYTSKASISVNISSPSCSKLTFVGMKPGEIPLRARERIS